MASVWINREASEVQIDVIMEASRVEILEALHESVDFCLETLIRCAPESLLCKFSDGVHILFHIQFTSYIADIPECENMLSVKRGNRIFSPCHICLESKEDLKSNKMR